MKHLRMWGPALGAAALIMTAWVTGYEFFMVVASVVAGWQIAGSAIAALRVKMISIDLLVVTAAAGAVVIHNYWEAAAVTFLFAVGKALEHTTMAKTRQALSDLVEAAPETARRIRLQEGGEVETETVELWQLSPGDTVLVRSGEQVPVDGEVTGGHGAVAEATITGESVPAEKSVGAQVFAGTWLRSGSLQVEARGIGSDSMLATIIRRVEDAQDDRAKTQTFLEKFSQYYTPAVMIGALLAGVLTRNVELALTILVIACPGALVISIPVSVVAGIGRSAKDGVLIKGGEYLERTAAVDTLVVDKTGTLTHGTPELTDVLALDTGYSEEQVLALAAAAESAAHHPLADAVVRGAQERGVPVVLPQQAEVVVGRGVLARVPTQVPDARVPDTRSAGTSRAALAAEVPTVQVAVGSAQLLETGADEALLRDFQVQGKTAMFVGVNGQAVGLVAVADTVRPEAKAAIDELHRRGIKVVMATGDAEPVARSVGQQLGLDDVRAAMLPEGKLELVRELQAAGRTVAMVGDGVNDTPALAVADVGVAMGAAGSPAALETADLALMSDRLDRLPYALGLAKSTVRTMKVNIAIALLTVALLVAGVFFGGVTMAIGMLVHEASVLLVIAIAMLLLRPRRL